MKTIIKNGTIVSATSEYKADILIEGEKIKLIGVDLKEPADKIIDAKDMYILPGGVDQHTHFEAINTDGETHNASYSTSYGLAMGGTTTIVEFAEQEPNMGLIDSAMYRKDVRAKGKIAVDFAMHALCTNSKFPTMFDEIPKLPDYGIPTMKLFLAYKPTSLYTDDAVFFKSMKLAAEAGVTMYAHAENADLLNLLRDEAFSKGLTTPKYHYLTRPPFVEAETIQRAILLADEAHCPLCIVHISSKEGAAIVKSARERGIAVVGETCTHYLTLDQSLMDNPDFDVACRWVCSPALRTQEHRDYLWKALNNDALSIVASDHVGIPLYQKHWGEKDFRAIPNGSPGGTERLSMLWTHGVVPGRISKQRLVQIYATDPAKMNGIFPRKGCIEVGSDADIVIYDPNYRGKISVETHPTGVEYNVFEGMEQIGRTSTVLLRGKTIVEKMKYVGKAGDGEFIPGKAFGLAYDLLEK